MNALSEGNNFRDIVRFELSETSRFCREVVTVLSGQVLKMGTVIAKILLSVATSGVAASGNTGGGTITSVTGNTKTKKGVYTIECLTYTASPLAATFSVIDPDGNSLPDASLGAYVNDQICMLIADGSPVIAVGDKWTITVSDGSGYVKGIDFDAVDGTQTAYGILTADVDATDGNTEGVAVVRDALIIADNLVYPTTSPAVTTDQKALALAALASKNIIEREEA